jgi:NAD(P)-dependent dehydrogenase (short-subunit alcohol dehydrogenase family)
MLLEGKVAIVTGGGRGIGRGIAHALAGEGATVVAAARSPADLEATARGLARRPGRIQACPCDVADAAQVRTLVRRTRRRFGGIDVLVCSHGIATVQPFLRTTERQWDQTLAVNLKGCFLVGQAVARAMVAGGRAGRIVFISSINGFGAEPQVTAYDASKAAVHGLTRSMAVELGRHGITVNAVAPGWVRTPLTEPFLTDGLRSGREVINPLRRVGEPADVAGAVLWLASPSSSYVTGSVVVVDGGQTAMLPLPADAGLL